MTLTAAPPSSLAEAPNASAAIRNGVGSRPYLRELPLILFLLLVAYYLRLSHLDLVQYRYDDDALWNIVMAMVRTGSLPTSGMPSSMGIHNGPFQAILLAPFGWLGGSPPFMTAGVGLYNVLGVAFVYGFARDFFGRRVGLIALLLVAANPWAVAYSRRLWGDDLVAPLAVLALWLLARWLWRRQTWAVVAAAAALAVLVQVYVVGIEYLASAAVAALMAGRKLISPWVALAAVVFAALLAPYAWFEVIPHFQMLVDVRDMPGAPTRLDLDSVRFSLILASNEGYQAYAEQTAPVLDASRGIPGALGAFARALYLLGLGVGVWTVVRGRGRLRDEARGIHVLLLVATLVPVAGLARHAVPLYPYYFVTTFPGPYLYGAIGLNLLWTCSARLTAPTRRLARGGLGAAVGGLVAVQCILGGVFFSVANEYRPNGNFGMTWSMVDRLVGEIRQVQQQYGATIIVVPQQNRETNMFYRVLAEEGANVTEYDERRMLVVVNQPALYIALGSDRAEKYLDETFPRNLVRMDRLPGNEAVLRYYVLPPASQIPAIPNAATPLDWSAGGLARLDGVELPDRVEPGRTVAATTFTTLLQHSGPSTPDFSIFAHLVRPDGQAVAGSDDAMRPTSMWEPGDHVVQWLDVPVPANAAPGELSVRMGMYALNTPTGLEQLPLFAPNGQQVAPSSPASTTVIPPPPPPPPHDRLAVQFADGIRLEGYDLARSGATLTVTLHWLATSSPSANETAFVHVLDASGRLVAQHDGPPDRGQFPSSSWQRGDKILDAHPISLPTGLSSGRYRLEIGMYDPHTLVRLPVISGAPLATIQISAE